MSLDVTLTLYDTKTHHGVDVYDGNITHNLNKMAVAAGIYEYLWRPESQGIATAEDLIDPLRKGLERLRGDSEYFEQFNATNGWGLHKDLVKFVADYLERCERFPTAKVSVSR